MKYVRTMITHRFTAGSCFCRRSGSRTANTEGNSSLCVHRREHRSACGHLHCYVLAPYTMMIKVQSADGRKAVMIAAIPSQELKESKQVKLVFHRFGNEYFLAQVWEQGSKVLATCGAAIVRVSWPETVTGRNS